jgi:transcriptional regulator with XRE-family HTH domain
VSDEAEENASGPGVDAVKPQFAVGPKLQAVRLVRGLSQRELARRANITNGTLSLIEQGKVSPSLASLEKILGAVPMSLSEFFSETPQAPVIHRAEEWVVQQQGGAESRLMPFHAGFEDTLRLLECRLAPEACQTASALLGVASGLMAGIVLEGELELRLDGVCQCLQVGDGFQFLGRRGQRLRNPGTSSCRFILFFQPAT